MFGIIYTGQCPSGQELARQITAVLMEIFVDVQVIVWDHNNILCYKKKLLQRMQSLLFIAEF